MKCHSCKQHRQLVTKCVKRQGRSVAMCSRFLPFHTAFLLHVCTHILGVCLYEHTPRNMHCVFYRTGMSSPRCEWLKFSVIWMTQHSKGTITCVESTCGICVKSISVKRVQEMCVVGVMLICVVCQVITICYVFYQVNVCQANTCHM